MLNKTHYYNKTIFFLLSFANTVSAQTVAISCFNLQEKLNSTISRLSDGNYNSPSVTNLNSLSPDDLFGRWEGTLPSGDNFTFNFTSKKDFFYTRFGNGKISVSGTYLLAVSETTGDTGIIFILNYIHYNGRKLLIWPKTPQYVSVLHEFYYHIMKLKTLSIIVDPAGHDFSYGLTDIPVDWKRDGDNPACNDLAEQMKEYKEKMESRVDDFQRKDLENKQSIRDIALKMRNVKNVLGIVDKPKDPYLAASQLLTEIESDIVRGALGGLPGIFFSIAYGALERKTKQVYMKEYITRLKNELSSAEKQHYYLVAEMRAQKEGIEGCRTFLNDHHKLLSELRCESP